jgi:hypothetical protein
LRQTLLVAPGDGWARERTSRAGFHLLLDRLAVRGDVE